MGETQMSVNKENYKKLADMRASKSPIFIDCIKAFLVGGAICVIAELLSTLYDAIGIDTDVVKMLVPVSIIFLTAIFTGIGLFDKLAKHAGAGTLVPICGFANAVIAPAIDNKAEGLVLGLGAKIFIIAGPVLLYGTLASAFYGIIYYFCSML